MSIEITNTPLPRTHGPGLPGHDVAEDTATSARTLGKRLQHQVRHLAKSDFVRKVVETYATQVVLIGLGLVTSVAVARTLGPQGRGLYAVTMTIGVIGVQLGNLGLHASNTFYLAQDRSLLPELVGNSLAVSFGFGGAVAAIVWLAFRVAPRLAPVQGHLLALGLAWIPVGLAFVLTENLLLGLQQVRSFNKVELLNRLLSLSLVGLVILSGRTTPGMVFAAALLSTSLTTGWTYRLLQGFAHIRPQISFRVLRAHIRLGIKAYLIALFGFLLLRIDLLMVKYFLGAEQAGYYSIASTMADYLLMLPSIIGLILFPRLSAMADRYEKLRQAKKVAMGTALVLIPLLVLASLTAEPVVHILFGTVFLPAVSPFLWLTPGIFAMGVQIAVVQFLNSIGYPPVVIWIWACATVLNIVLNFWAIPRFGLTGASVVSSISYSLVLLAVVMVIIASELRPHLSQPTAS
jgi:O-antigen/teichoic acid export membrane protein